MKIRDDMNLTYRPFLLSPVGKDYLWGGTRLRDEFSKEVDLVPLAETWECSTHQDGVNRVVSGEHEGRLLSDVLQKHPEYMGYHLKYMVPQGEEYHGELPILVKLIDAKNNLSVQVHPNDSYARTYENGSPGKTEVWYVMDAARDAEVIYGFHHDLDQETLRRSLSEGTVEKYLRKVPVKKNDVFYIEAGMVHAIGAGVLIAEIQENSNLTYRMYDYHRVDKDGRERELHIDRALDVANLKSSVEPRQPMRVLKYRRGIAMELLCRCRYFQVERMLLNTERTRSMVEYQTNLDSFQVLLCIDGCGMLFDDQDFIKFFKGDCIFIPANSNKLKLHGQAQLLKVSC